MLKRLEVTGLGLAVAMALTALGTATRGEVAAQQPQQVPAEDITDEELENFAVAYLDVDRITQEMTQQLRLVDDPERQQEIQEEARAEMTEAVEQQDLTVQRYSEIAAALNQNEELREKFVEILEEVREGAR